MLGRSRLIVVWALLVALVGHMPSSAAAQAPRQPTAREFSAPVLTFPTGVAAAPDGSIWVASTYSDKLLRFDPSTGQARDIPLPHRSHPVGVLVDPQGAVWYAASGLGLVGRLDPGAARPKEFAIPSIADARSAIPSPWAIALEPAGSHLWFTVVSDGIVGRVALTAKPQRRGFAVSELSLGRSTVRPEGIAADHLGSIWIAETGADSLARIRTGDGAITRVHLPPGSRPRGIASAPDGTIWVTLFGTHQLLEIKPGTLETRTSSLPSRAGSSPWAIVVDQAGAVWVGEFAGNTVARFDPRSRRFTTVPLPTTHSGVRALAVDGVGRVWFAGSESGRLGVIE
jgi:virginiamycin B lyase